MLLGANTVFQDCKVSETKYIANSLMICKRYWVGLSKLEEKNIYFVDVTISKKTSPSENENEVSIFFSSR